MDLGICIRHLRHLRDLRDHAEQGSRTIKSGAAIARKNSMHGDAGNLRVGGSVHVFIGWSAPVRGCAPVIG